VDLKPILMKQILLKTFTFLAVLCVLGVSSCRRCTDESCKNGGVCESGKCICPFGFFGYSCELTQGNSTTLGNLVFYTTNSVSNTCGYYQIEISSLGQRFITSSTSTSSVSCGTANSANFTNVPYGSYTYNVYCYNTGALLSTGSVTVNSSCVKKLVNPSTTSSTGLVTFYSNSINSSCTYYQIQLSSLGTQYIQSTYSSVNCGQTNCANFTNVPYGTYNYDVYCYNTGSLLTSGSVNVNASCVKQLVNPSVSSFGQLSFYALTGSQVMSVCNPATIQITGYGSDYVSAIRTTAPTNCTTSGCANFSLPPGTYTATVVSCGILGNYTLGTYNVTAGNCQKVQLP